MCLIIDTNRISDVVARSDDAMPVLKWLLTPDARIAIGGTKLQNEYQKHANFMKLLATLDTGGRVRRYGSEDVDREEAQLSQSGLMTSDDPHVLALAVVSGCRLLYSDDAALHQDFGNLRILRPKGKVYQYKSHSHLLKTAARCA